MTPLKFIAVSVMAVVSLSVAKLSADGPFHPGAITLQAQHHAKKHDSKKGARPKMLCQKYPKVQQLPAPSNRRQMQSASPGKRKVPATTMD
jgi:hypothetical protein